MNIFSRIRSLLKSGGAGVGKAGEDAAADYLRKSGYKILERNWRCKLGELDLIASKSGVIVFVEVKASATRHAIEPQHRVNRQKQKKLTQLAQYFRRTASVDAPCRFDVIAVWWESGVPNIQHWENAF